MDSIYTNGQTKVNNIVVHDPVSVREQQSSLLTAAWISVSLERINREQLR